jgi:hypothetical protein
MDGIARRRLAAVSLLTLSSIGSTRDLAAQHAERRGPQAFAIEAAGATAGSIVTAFATYVLLNNTRGPCGSEDLSCLLGRIGAIGVASAAGAAGGGYVAGRASHTQPSGAGSVLGAIVGVGLGAAAIKGLDELGARQRWIAAVSYPIVQGLSTATFSRLLARR